MPTDNSTDCAMNHAKRFFGLVKIMCIKFHRNMSRTVAVPCSTKFLTQTSRLTQQPTMRWLWYTPLNSVCWGYIIHKNKLKVRYGTTVTTAHNSLETSISYFLVMNFKTNTIVVYIWSWKVIPLSFELKLLAYWIFLWSLYSGPYQF